MPKIQSEFVRHVATLMAGRTGGMVISFLLIPVISRLFMPEHFGSAAVFAAAVAVLGGVCSLKYPRAAILPDSDTVAGELMVLSAQLLNAFVLFLYSGFLVFWWLNGIPPLYATIGAWVWLLPVGVWLYGAMEIMMSASNREKTYRMMSISDISQTLTTSGGRVGAGLVAGSSVGGLVATGMAGDLVRLYMLSTKKWNIARLACAWPGWIRLWSKAKEYRDFPLYDTPASLAASLSTKLPIFAMGLIYSPVVAGFYAMADRVIGLPMHAAGNSIRRVFLRKAAELRGKKRSIVAPYWKVVAALAVSGLAPFMVLWWYGEEIMSFVLGERWRSAGQYAEILAPWLFSAWVTIAVPSAMIALRKQRLWAGMQIVSMLIRAAVFGIAYIMVWNPEMALNIFAWVNVFIGAILLIMAWRVISRDEKRRALV